MNELNYLQQLAVDVKENIEGDVKLIKQHLKKRNGETAQSVLDGLNSNFFLFKSICEKRINEDNKEEVYKLINEVHSWWVDIDDEMFEKINC